MTSPADKDDPGNSNVETDLEYILGNENTNEDNSANAVNELDLGALDEPNNPVAGEGDLGFISGIPDSAGLSLNLPGFLGQEQSEEDQERERMQLLVSHFDEQQMARYAAFRRANIRRAAVKKYASQLLNQPISNSVAVVLAGMSKVLIGDIIELARDLQEKEQAAERKQLGLPQPDPGSEPEPLLPSYIREAWRIYKQDTGTVPGPKTTPGSANRFF